MKAIVFSETGGPDVLKLGDVPKPDVRPGMALIKVHAIGVNFADTRFRQGTYVVTPKLPDTPGMRVAAFTVKAYAEYCQAPAHMVIALRHDGEDAETAERFPLSLRIAEEAGAATEEVRTHARSALAG